MIRLRSLPPSVDVPPPAAVCWHECGQRVRSLELHAMTDDEQVVEVWVCGRPWCEWLAVARDIVSDLAARWRGR